MRYFVFAITLVITALTGRSQTYEIGGFLGGANYIGEIGNTTYINPNTLAVGGIVKWNRSNRHSFRGSIIIAGIKSDDANSSESRRQQRGLRFQNTITEASLGIEYSFWEFSLHKERSQRAPYLYTGITYFTYNALQKGRNNTIVKFDNAGTFAIPMVVGYKFSLGTKTVLGLEIGARYTFTDNLDGSNPQGDLENIEQLRFGNINNDDWYVFTGVTFTFAFGRKPCYCNF